MAVRYSTRAVLSLVCEKDGDPRATGPEPRGERNPV
jgi:hypothetical protein